MHTILQNAYHLYSSCLGMPYSCIWSMFSRCPSLTLSLPKQWKNMAPANNCNKTKKGNKQLQRKQHIKTCTISWAHALQCLLYVFGTFFQGALSWPLSSSKERKKGHLQKMSQNEDMVPEGNVVSTLGPTPQKNVGLKFDSFSQQNLNRTCFIFNSGYPTNYTFSLGSNLNTFTRFEKNIFLSSTLGPTKNYSC